MLTRHRSHRIELLQFHHGFFISPKSNTQSFGPRHGVVNNLRPKIKWFRTSNCLISWLKWYSQSDLANCQTKYWSASWRTPNGLFGAPLELCVTVTLWIGFWMFDVYFRWRNLVCTKLQLTHRLRVQILKYAWPYASRKAAVAPVKSWATKRVCKQAANALDTLDTPINGKVMLQHIQHHLLAMSHAVSHAARFFSCWLVTVVNDRCDPWNQLMKSALWWTTNGEVHSLQNQG